MPKALPDKSARQRRANQASSIARPPRKSQTNNNNNNNINASNMQNITQKPATKFLLDITGTVGLDMFFSLNPKENVREIFEQVSPPDQCKNVIGKFEISSNGGVKGSVPEEENYVKNFETVLRRDYETNININAFLDATTKERLLSLKGNITNTMAQPEFIPETTCWLCGELLDKPLTFGLAPECEHVLPVIQAAYFLELYGKYHANIKNNIKKALTVIKNVSKITPAKIKEITDALNTYNTELPKFRKSLLIMLKEYAWAHAGCNRIKKNKCFIYTKPDKSGVDAYLPLLKAYLKDVFNDSTHQEIIPVQEILKKRYSNFEAFYNARIKYITKRLNDICDFINGCNITDVGCEPDFDKICAAGAIHLLSAKTIGAKYASQFERIKESLKLAENNTQYLNFNMSVFKQIKENIFGYISLKNNKDIDKQIDTYFKNLEKNFNIAHVFTQSILRAYIMHVVKADLSTYDKFILKFSDYLTHIFIFILHNDILNTRASKLTGIVKPAKYIPLGSDESETKFFILASRSYTIRALKKNLKKHIDLYSNYIVFPTLSELVEAEEEKGVNANDAATAVATKAAEALENAVIANPAKKKVLYTSSEIKLKSINQAIKNEQKNILDEQRVLFTAELEAIDGLLQLSSRRPGFAGQLQTEMLTKINLSKDELASEKLVRAVSDYCIVNELLSEYNQLPAIPSFDVDISPAVISRAEIPSLNIEAEANAINISPFIYKLYQECPTLDVAGNKIPTEAELLNEFDNINPYDLYSEDVINAAHILIGIKHPKNSFSGYPGHPAGSSAVYSNTMNGSNNSMYGKNISPVNLANKIRGIIEPEVAAAIYEPYVRGYLQSISNNKKYIKVLEGRITPAEMNILDNYSSKTRVFGRYPNENNNNNNNFGGGGQCLRHKKRTAKRRNNKRHIKTRKHKK